MSRLWRISECLCAHCGHREVSVIPAECTARAVQCSRCEKMEAAEMRDLDPEEMVALAEMFNAQSGAADSS